MSRPRWKVVVERAMDGETYGQVLDRHFPFDQGRSANLVAMSAAECRDLADRLGRAAVAIDKGNHRRRGQPPCEDYYGCKREAGHLGAHVL